MKNLRVVIYVLFVAVLAACGGTTGYTGPSVNIANVVEVELHLNTRGEFVLTGEASIPITPIELMPLGVFNWDIGFETVFNEAKQTQNYLYLIWEDDSGELYRESYNLGQPFQINFEHESWVRRITNTSDGDIIVEIEKQLMPGYEPNSTSYSEPPLAPIIQTSSGPTSYPTMEISCPGAPPIRVEVGNLVRVTTTDGDNLRLRSSPEVANNILQRVPAGLELRIIGGPVCSDNFSYWEVKIPGTSQTGWIAEGDYSIYYVEPIY